MENITLARNISSMGRRNPKNILVSEAIDGYAILLQNILKLPSEVTPPKAISEIPPHVKEKWQWHLFEAVPNSTNQNKVIVSPADLIKVRMQADSQMMSRGLQPRYSWPFDAFNKIVQAEGFQGLWKGVFPNIQRAFLVNMGELACYDHAKQFVITNRIPEDNVDAHTLASIMSGQAATSLSCPADVVKTRMMNQAAKREGNVLYRSSYDCLVKTVQVEGIKAL